MQNVTRELGYYRRGGKMDGQDKHVCQNCFNSVMEEAEKTQFHIFNRYFKCDICLEEVNHHLKERLSVVEAINLIMDLPTFETPEIPENYLGALGRWFKTMRSILQRTSMFRPPVMYKPGMSLYAGAQFWLPSGNRLSVIELTAERNEVYVLCSMRNCEGAGLQRTKRKLDEVLQWMRQYPVIETGQVWKLNEYEMQIITVERNPEGAGTAKYLITPDPDSPEEEKAYLSALGERLCKEGWRLKSR